MEYLVNGPTIFPSPAKVNLFLHVIGQREDGYHLLQTAFQFLNFKDELVFKVTDDPSIRVRMDKFSIPPDDNLITRAASLLQNYAAIKKGVAIDVKKRIPMGSGLGGGSSNAATTLVALNRLWNIHLSQNDLMTLGLTLGADVPIFIYGKSAFAEGIGEKLEPLQIPEPWFLLLFPNCHTSTQKIFSDSQLTRNTPKITIMQFLENGGGNDCVPVARKHFPEIAEALDCLNQYTTAKMTGTGSCVFSTFEDETAAFEVAEKIPASFNAKIFKGVNHSPLYDAI